MLSRTPAAALPKDRRVVLLTGFGPFPSVAANATSLLVPRIAEAARQAFTGSQVICRILPTEWGTGLDQVAALHRELRPALALHFGVSGRASGFEIETRGRNHCQQSQDAAGCLPESFCVTPSGPEYLASTLPAAQIVARLRRRGIPAMISRDAGGYLCNALLYRALEVGRANGTPARIGFVHLPAALVNERNPSLGPRSGCRLDWPDVVDGGLEIIATSLGQPTAPVRRTGSTMGRSIV